MCFRINVKGKNINRIGKTVFFSIVDKKFYMKQWDITMFEGSHLRCPQMVFCCLGAISWSWNLTRRFSQRCLLWIWGHSFFLFWLGGDDHSSGSRRLRASLLCYCMKPVLNYCRGSRGATLVHQAGLVVGGMSSATVITSFIRWGNRMSTSWMLGHSTSFCMVTTRLTHIALHAWFLAQRL